MSVDRDDAAMVVQKPVVAMLAKYRERIAAVVPKFMDDTRVLKLISGEIQRNPKLLECVPVSVLNCVVQAASLGLEIRPKVCYLVPLKDGRTGKMQCNLWLDYRGEIDLIKRSGDCTSVNAQVVYSKDQFEYDITERGIHLLHRPLKFRRNGEEMIPVTQAGRGSPIGAYMLAALTAGGAQIDFMSLDEIQQRQKISKNTGADSPWVKHWDEMAVKTVIHHGAKMLRQTPDLVKAQELGDRTESGEGPEYVFDVEPEDVDMGKPFLPAGSSEQQAQVAERKIEELKKTANVASPGGVIPSKMPAWPKSDTGTDSQDADRLTPEENRALDEEILRKEQAEQDAAKKEHQQRIVDAEKGTPRPRLRFGVKP